MKKLIASIAVAISLLTLNSNALAAYEVKAGDTMSEIAVANGLTLQELAALNTQVADLNLIFVGQEIKTDNSAVRLEAAAKAQATAYEKDLLARLVRAEATGEPFTGKVAVARVVLNRVESPNFPNTIQGVIYQRSQFTPVLNGEINKPADADSIRAVEVALGESRTASLYFYNPMTASSRWLDSRPTTQAIGNHIFKK